MPRGLLTSTSLYTRVFLTLAAVIALVVVIGGTVISRLVERRVVEHLTASLATLTRVIAPQATAVLRDTPTGAAAPPLARQLSELAGSRITLIAGNGSVLGDSERTEETVPLLDNHAARPEVAAALAGRLGTSVRYSETLREPLLYVAQPLIHAGATVGVLRA